MLDVAPIIGSVLCLLLVLPLVRRERWSTPGEALKAAGGFVAVIVIPLVRQTDFIAEPQIERLPNFAEQFVARHVVAEIDGCREALCVGASVALDHDFR